MIGPDDSWVEGWQLGLDEQREREVSVDLLEVFDAFWNAEDLDDRSETTRRRYDAGLHALGGYLVEKAVTDEGKEMTVDGLLAEYLDEVEGPLIHHDNEVWQRELDTVCRKLYRYLQTERSGRDS